jgi:hypothetical protein
VFECLWALPHCRFVLTYLMTVEDPNTGYSRNTKLHIYIFIIRPQTFCGYIMLWYCHHCHRHCHPLIDKNGLRVIT